MSRTPFFCCSNGPPDRPPSPGSLVLTFPSWTLLSKQQTPGDRPAHTQPTPAWPRLLCGGGSSECDGAFPRQEVAPQAPVARPCSGAPMLGTRCPGSGDNQEALQVGAPLPGGTQSSLIAPQTRERPDHV